MPGRKKRKYLQATISSYMVFAIKPIAMEQANQKATETGMDNEGDSSDVDQQGSCCTQKLSYSNQKGTKKRKVGSNNATKHGVGYKTKWETDFPWLLQCT